MKKSFLILVLAVAVAAFNPAQTAAQTGAQTAAQTGTQTAAQTAALSIRDVPYVICIPMPAERLLRMRYI